MIPLDTLALARTKSGSTRRRLIEAAITALDEDGYANTSVSRITELSGMSRGGHLHHFASKLDLFEAVADQLVRHVFIASGRLVLGVGEPGDRFERLVQFLWRDVFATREGRACLELLHAARTDPVLGERLRPSALKAMRIFGRAGQRLFETIPQAPASLASLTRLALFALQGMALNAVLARDPAYFDREANALVAMIGPFVRGRV
jgi:AcrR family transcriptional regulator